MLHDQLIHRRHFVASAALGTLGALAGQAPGDPVAPQGKRFRAGAVAKDITPREFPVVINGNFGPGKAERVNSRLYARALVLDDGASRVAIVAVDSCLMSRDLLDEAKQLAQRATGIPAERILISATHTHSAPSVLSLLGCPEDTKYAPAFAKWLAEAIEQAAANLSPARIGWTAVKAEDFNDCRQGIFRPDQMGDDPFGQKTTRAMMHVSGLGPAGPTDPDLSILAIQSPEGRPVALLGNYAMHYFGSPPVSSDAAGLFCLKVAELLGGTSAPPVVGIFSQGTSGDAFWRAYHKPQATYTLDSYAEGLARLACEGYKSIRFHDWVPLAMAETTLRLRRRAPDAQRLAWAHGVLEGKIRPPSGLSKIYAQEALYLHEKPEAELKLQAIRLGDLAITAMPNEVYAITGLKIKAMSPLPATMNISAANGSEGYIPPPEQHKLGGYTTWPARSAGLEEQAEPKILETVLGLLEKVAGKPRRVPDPAISPYAKTVLAAKPAAYWRMREFTGPLAADASGNQLDGAYEDGVAFYLEGPPMPGCRSGVYLARAARFIAGRMKAEVKNISDTYSVAFWFWNALPPDARAVTGWLFARSAGSAPDAPGDWLGIGGTGAGSGRLILGSGRSADECLVGATPIALRTWHHVVLVRQGENLAVYLDGRNPPEIVGRRPNPVTGGASSVFLGGRWDRSAGLEGKIAEVALYDRALTASQAAEHFAAAR